MMAVLVRSFPPDYLTESQSLLMVPISIDYINISELIEFNIMSEISSSSDFGMDGG